MLTLRTTTARVTCSQSRSNMESPHEQQQNQLLSRIITNVEKLNEAIAIMNSTLQDINFQNMNIELVAQMFKNYQSNVLFHLEATDNLKDPA
ncbi:DASH complex subunit dad4 [Coniochaeta pulveracea]|uniref:DASH complex subunit DAD4 n=1 Tax=Coniochaeta pulveracea TaxID=177199 RepID=A0A420YDA7_9PEZI|nr:DASH complex subunit dad4 [Coniochaeta pulveracea]